MGPGIRAGASLVSVAESPNTGTAAGRLVLNIMTAVSQWEREAIRERTRDAMHHKRANGERVGAVPFGCCTAADRCTWKRTRRSKVSCRPTRRG